MGIGIQTIVGEVKMWAGGGTGSDNAVSLSNPPAIQEVKVGWLLCNGATFANATYPNLAAEIGSAFNLGDEGVGNTRLPNCQQRIPIGRALAAPGASIGERGGTLTEALATINMPLHSHTGVTDANDRDHTHGSGSLFIGANLTNGPSGFAPYTGSGFVSFFYTTSGSTAVAGATGGQNTLHYHTFSTNNVGGGLAHNNVPPYITLHFIIKY